MRKFIIAVAALLASVSTTHATDWWLVDAGKGRCLNAAAVGRQYHSPEFASPGAMQTSLRSDGTFEGIKIIRDDGNNVSTVLVTSSKGIVLVYAATHETCEDTLRRLIDNGTVATKRELD